MTTELPAAVIAPAQFRARCSLCGVEVHSATGWRDHVASPGHALQVADKQVILQQKLDEQLAEMDRASKCAQLILRAMRMSSSEDVP